MVTCYWGGMVVELTTIRMFYRLVLIIMLSWVLITGAVPVRTKQGSLGSQGAQNIAATYGSVQKTTTTTVRPVERTTLAPMVCPVCLARFNTLQGYQNHLIEHRCYMCHNYSRDVARYSHGHMCARCHHAVSGTGRQRDL